MSLGIDIIVRCFFIPNLIISEERLPGGFPARILQGRRRFFCLYLHFFPGILRIKTRTAVGSCRREIRCPYKEYILFFLIRI